MKLRLGPSAWAFVVLGLQILTVQAATTATVASSVYLGLVQHVSPTAIKVSNPKDKTSETFTIAPKVTHIFWADGKTNAQMGALVVGQFVKVYFAQERLGARRADRIVILLGSRLNQGVQLR